MLIKFIFYMLAKVVFGIVIVEHLVVQVEETVQILWVAVAEQLVSFYQVQLLQIL